SARFRSWVTSPRSQSALLRAARSAPSRVSAIPSARVARIASQVLTAVPTTRAVTTTAAVASTARFRRADFRSRYHADGGPASTGSWLRWRRRSATRLLAVSYRRLRSFSRHFITIQSSSPHSDLRSRRESVWRAAETVVAVPPSVLTRVLGLGGS